MKLILNFRPFYLDFSPAVLTNVRLLTSPTIPSRIILISSFYTSVSYSSAFSLRFLVVIPLLLLQLFVVLHFSPILRFSLVLYLFSYFNQVYILLSFYNVHFHLRLFHSFLLVFLKVVLFLFDSLPFVSSSLS